MVSISVCMIVKNEEKILARCLDSLAGLAEEMIIVDTGSTDRTKEIAKQYTDFVFDFTWVDDFSAARNFSISKATKEFIYIADADEVIDEENRQKFILLKKSLLPEIDVVEMKVGNQLAYNTTYNFDVEYRVKMFRRIHQFRFCDPIHETLHFAPGLYQSEVEITHMPVGCHGGRDLSAFAKLVEQKAELSLKLQNMYARELFICGEEKDFLCAYPYFLSILQDGQSTERQIRLAECVVAHSARIAKNEDVFYKTVLKSIANSPCAEICCELGSFYMEKQDYTEAALWFFTAVHGAESELYLPYAGKIPLEKLSACYRLLGDTEKASAYGKMALEWEWPNDVE